MALRRVIALASRSSTNYIVNQKRCFALAVRFHQNGEAEKVYKLETLDSSFVSSPLGPKEIGLKFLAAPINPSDLNIASGTYGIKPKLPAIGGNEGCAEVTAIGSEVKEVKVGDWVLPVNGAFGTWTQYNKANVQDIITLNHIFSRVNQRMIVDRDEKEKAYLEEKDDAYDENSRLQDNHWAEVVNDVLETEFFPILKVKRQREPDDVHDHMLSPFAQNDDLGTLEWYERNQARAKEFEELRDQYLDGDCKDQALKSRLEKLRDEFLHPGNLVHPALLATLSINPSTGYRLLKDFVPLKKGDWIIQNGGNSMVGQAVVQFAKEWGFKTINIVRHDRRDAMIELRLLTNLGGDINILDDYLATKGFKEIISEIQSSGGSIKLGLNCIGGESATEIARCLSPGASLISYGGMSRKPLSLPFEVITANNLQIKGFWIADWYNTHSKEEREAMYEDIIFMYLTHRYTTFLQTVDMDDFDWALKQATEPMKFRKIVLLPTFPDRFAEHDKKTDDDYWVFDTTVN